ncbi:MAG: hypothetical protein JHC71_06065 [Blastococcus sp.]|nr:hypothetical protein [Blastococcus sp.]
MASGLAVALVAVPGIAFAEETAPANPLTDAVEDATVGDPAEIGEQLVEDLPIPLPGAGTDTGGTGTGEEEEVPTTPPPFVVPDELKALFAQAGFSAECVDGVTAGLEQFGAGLAALFEFEEYAAELEAFLTALSEADPAEVPLIIEDVLTGFVPAEGEAGPSEDIIGGLELVLASLESCVPTPPAGEEPEEPAPPVTPVGGGAPQAPAPQVQESVAQPVSYPGYAPTGAGTAKADDVSVPLTALGGGLVLVAAGAAGYGMRGRAVRTRD